MTTQLHKAIKSSISNNFTLFVNKAVVAEKFESWKGWRSASTTNNPVPLMRATQLLYSTSCGDSSIKILQSVIVDREQGEVRIQPYDYQMVLIGHVNNIPTMQFLTGISSNTQSRRAICYYWLSVSANSKIMHWGILINTPYYQIVLKNGYI